MAISKDMKDSEREAGSLVRCRHRASEAKRLDSLFRTAVGDIMLTYKTSISIIFHIYYSYVLLILNYYNLCIYDYICI